MTTVGGLQGDSGGLGGDRRGTRGTAAITVYLYNTLYNNTLKKSIKWQH